MPGRGAGQDPPGTPGRAMLASPHESVPGESTPAVSTVLSADAEPFFPQQTEATFTAGLSQILDLRPIAAKVPIVYTCDPSFG